MKSKICFVVQRYGLEVNGGAELQCRQFAEHMNEMYDVEVVTTKAIDYISWKNEYSKDEEIINGVLVKRFPVERERTSKEFDNINGRFLRNGLNSDEELEWVIKQGPFSPKLLEYLKTHKDTYKAFVFFTYLYYPTVLGMQEVRNKAIFIPEAHDEPYMKMDIIKRLFSMPRSFFFNTEEEEKLVRNMFHNENIPSQIGGIGIDKIESLEVSKYKAKYNLDKYVVYVGRIDRSKNCHVLFNYFREYKKRNDNKLKLVLIGKNVIDIPKDENIIPLGFVDEEDKTNVVAGAEALVLPSEFESLSMVVLEAMNVMTPVMVNGKCNVLKGHCVKSNGAFYYNNYFEFEGEINYLLSHQKEKEILTHNAKKYVDMNYRWEVVVKRFSKLIDEI